MLFCELIWKQTLEIITHAKSPSSTAMKGFFLKIYHCSQKIIVHSLFDEIPERLAKHLKDERGWPIVKKRLWQVHSYMYDWLNSGLSTCAYHLPLVHRLKTQPCGLNELVTEGNLPQCLRLKEPAVQLSKPFQNFIQISEWLHLAQHL